MTKYLFCFHIVQPQGPSAKYNPSNCFDLSPIIESPSNIPQIQDYILFISPSQTHILRETISAVANSVAFLFQSLD
jgi:hypothetical protein